LPRCRTDSINIAAASQRNKPVAFSSCDAENAHFYRFKHRFERFWSGRKSYGTIAVLPASCFLSNGRRTNGTVPVHQTLIQVDDVLFTHVGQVLGQSLAGSAGNGPARDGPAPPNSPHAGSRVRRVLISPDRCISQRWLAQGERSNQGIARLRGRRCFRRFVSPAVADKENPPR
jgi:hypothetical protein